MRHRSMSLSEKDLLDVITSAQKGDEKAWCDLVSTYSKVIWSATYNYGFSNDIREEIVQDVFVKLVNSIKSYNSNKAAFSTFITVITKRTCIDRLRMSGRNKEIPFTPEELAIFPSQPPEESIYEQEIIDSLHNALNKQLTSDQKLLITLFYYKKYPYKKITEIMNRNEHWVKNTLHRTKAYLKQILAAHSGDKKS